MKLILGIFLLIGIQSASASVYKCVNETTGQIEYKQSPCNKHGERGAYANPDASFSVAEDQKRVHLEGRIYQSERKIQKLQSDINRMKSNRNISSQDSYSRRLELKNYERKLRANMSSGGSSLDRMRNERAIQNSVNERKAIMGGNPLYIDRREININVNR